MNAAEYDRLCAACDDVLRRRPTIERVAIAWLHVLNEHPSNAARYAAVIGAAPPRRLHAMRSAASQGLGWLRARGRVAAAPLPPRADVVFVSHLLNEKQVGGEDFYFGPLPEAATQRGLASAVLLHSHTSAGPAASSAWGGAFAPRVVLPQSLGIVDELANRRRLAREARRIASETAGDGLAGRVKAEAGRQAVATSSLAALRSYRQMQRTFARLRPRAVFVTWEGHAWERLAFAAAREIDPSVVCVGYHHTILFPRQHAALRPLGRPYDPDVVLTAGDVSAGRFEAALAAAGVRVRAVGIHRRQAEPIPGREPDRDRTCLVVPDGITSEIERLFDFAIAAARAAPDRRFVLRLHPVVPRAALLEQFPRFRALPPNVELSDRTFNDDLPRARWVLYRGSNASIYAVIAGLRPFYVDGPGEMSIDALNDLKTWKRVVQTPEQFIGASEQDAAGEAAPAIAYCRRYFIPLDADAALGVIPGAA